jgi:hypothetical protein
VKLGPAKIEPTPDVFAAVMATGIVSSAARNHHCSKLSDAPWLFVRDAGEWKINCMVLNHKPAPD